MDVFVRVSMEQFMACSILHLHPNQQKTYDQMRVFRKLDSWYRMGAVIWAEWFWKWPSLLPENSI